MGWIKIVTGFVIMMVVIVAWFRVMKQIRGDGGSGVDLNLPKRRRNRQDDGANDLERFIQSHRAGEIGQAAAPSTAPLAVGAAISPLARTQPASSSQPPAPMNQAPTLLAGPHRLLYLILKTGLPGHHIFPRVALRDIVPAATARADVGAHALTFVVCGSDFSAIAAIELAPLPDSIRAELVQRALAASGIRHVVLDPAALPRPAAVRGLVYGH